MSKWIAWVGEATPWPQADVSSGSWEVGKEKAEVMSGDLTTAVRQFNH